MSGPTYLIYLDDYHLDDPLFLPGLAQRMGRLRRVRPRCLFLHGNGGHAERLLEAEGLFPGRRGGLIDARTVEEAALVERAVRQVNRRIVGVLTDEGVHAVGFKGSDRGLLRVDAGGGVVAGNTGWLDDLVRKGAVPVVAALVGEAPGAAREVPLQAAAVAMAQALTGDVVVVFFTRGNQPGDVAPQAVREQAVDDVPPAILPAPEALRAVVKAGREAFITSVAGLFGGGEPLGTRVFLSKTAKKD